MAHRRALRIITVLSAPLLGAALGWQLLGPHHRVTGDPAPPWAAASTPPATSERQRSDAPLPSRINRVQRLEELLRDSRGNGERDAEIARLIGSLAEEDPAAAAELAQRRLSGRLRNEAVYAVISRWAAAAPDAALEWIATQPAGDARDAALRALLPALVRRDRELGAMLARALDAGPLREDLLAQSVSLWAATDPDGAVAWIEGAPAPLRDQARAHLAQRWAERDPERAAAYAQGLLAGSTRTRILTTIGVRWSTTAPEAASAWALGLSEAAARQRVLSGVLSAWAEREPGRAASFAASLPAGPVRGEVLTAAVSAWSLQEPRAAGAWVSGYAGPGRDEAIRSVAWQWARQELPGLVAWRDSLPTMRERDTCALTAAAAVRDVFPAAAARWSEQIEDPTLRRTQMERTARRWLEVDPAAARAWITQSDLPPDQKVALGG